MKRKIALIVITAVTAIATFNINISTQEYGLSDISFDNVEALANENGSGSESTKKCWQGIKNGDGTKTHQTYCGDCDPILCTYWYNESQCTK